MASEGTRSRELPHRLTRVGVLCGAIACLVGVISNWGDWGTVVWAGLAAVWALNAYWWMVLAARWRTTAHRWDRVSDNWEHINATSLRIAETYRREHLQ